MDWHKIKKLCFFFILFASSNSIKFVKMDITNERENFSSRTKLTNIFYDFPDFRVFKMDIYPGQFFCTSTL